MSRRSYKTINLPRQVVNWIDATLNGKPAPLGITSRDEFVRVAVAILGTALQPAPGGEAPLQVIQGLLRELEKQRQVRNSDSAVTA